MKKYLYSIGTLMIISVTILAEDYSGGSNVDSITSASVNATSGAASNMFNTKNYFGLIDTKYEFDLKFNPMEVPHTSSFIIPPKIFIDNPGKWAYRSFEIMRERLSESNIETVDYLQTSKVLKEVGHRFDRSFVPEEEFNKIFFNTGVDLIIQPVISMKNSTGGGMLFPKNNYITHVELRIYSTSMSKWLYYSEAARRRRVTTFSILNAAQNYAGTAVDMINSFKNSDKLWYRSFKDTVDRVLSPFIQYIEDGDKK